MDKRKRREKVENCNESKENKKLNKFKFKVL